MKWTIENFAAIRWMLCLLLAGPATACGPVDDDGQNGQNGGDSPTTCADVDRSIEADPPPNNGDDATLSGTYRISNKATYNSGETVTIEPGTVFLMESETFFQSGSRGDAATVIAEGTADEPILFCGTEATPGHWEGVTLDSGTRDESKLEHVRIEDAGANDEPGLINKPTADLVSVTVTNSAAKGMLLQDLGEGSSDLTVTENEGTALDLRGRNAITNLPSGEYSGNGTDVALVQRFDDTNTTFHDIGIPYRQDTSDFAYGSAGGDKSTLTFEAGVEYQFCQDCYFTMGWRSDPAALKIKGTADKPVVFTSHRGGEAQPGDWDGIQIQSGTTSESVIEHAEFHYGGKSGGGNVIISGGNIRISNSTFTDSAGAGIFVKNEGDVLDMSGNEFKNNAEGEVVRKN